MCCCYLFYTYFRAYYINLRFKHAILDVHRSCLAGLAVCLGKYVNVIEKEKGVVALHLPIGPLKPDLF